MFLDRLRLINYRNFKDETFSFSEGNLILGDNAQGKSNLLEAIYYLSVARSARGASDRDIIGYGGEGFSIEAAILRGGRERSVKVIYSGPRGKEAYVDGGALPRLSVLIGVFNSVLFLPEKIDLTLRTASGRRRMLDMLISQSSPPYLHDLQAYRRALAQRNALLRKLSSEPGPYHGYLEPWDEQLVKYGVNITAKRLEVLKSIGKDIKDVYYNLGEGEELSLSYRCSLEIGDPSDMAKELSGLLRERLSEELRLGFTLSGPHRDDIEFYIDGREMLPYASQGQIKSVFLSWKFCEALFLKRATGYMPVLLLDDLFSELDAKRCGYACEALKGFGQVIVTSARDASYGLDRMGFKTIRIAGGRCVG